jgi:hypothetical protein
MAYLIASSVLESPTNPIILILSHTIAYLRALVLARAREIRPGQL